MSSPNLAELNCPSCRHTEILAIGGVVRRLTSLGMLRRNHDVEWDVLWELLKSSLGNLKCTACNHSGLTLSVGDKLDDEAWGAPRHCDGCDRPIDPERLNVLPDVRLCSTCQQRNEQGDTPQEEPEFCQRCGALLLLKPSRGPGITRYEYRCPECGAR
ncbi:MAG: hypothetical protein CMJ81_16070 [Planctomycetaceae bacterium]|jgi:DNA-directed RNA polymerase subunit RPC12/RpoP|nr:hypothetical protein [Planctomycetaceae bacterium]MBP62258.1 hypothetical protein [Planctomycetaceae bacterium]